ncbi:PilZ domain-containing protein [Sphingomonas sp. OV641]|uniref:PilZ domain-containing protein n=1 Tax=Sphingomonas sp. OV641 TaxID=1881068 RepID=UPI0008BF909E|nr:PilZ domain-containing protein [Sphingomonas sp. OV641]SEI91597.1 PilZ domain-containing protein [Sphingomonas sp. OV641]
MDSAASVFLDPKSTGPDDRGRDSLSLLARLKVLGADATFTVRVRNLSSGGLMAELPEPVTPDSAVQIELGELGWLEGRVAWQTEGRAGIAFDTAIDPQRVHKSAGQQQRTPDLPAHHSLGFPDSDKV